ncbi:MAG TPA: nucleoid-associated protein [Bacteroidales bacterium]|nr:nucleoid-associated protein [Bacteroidales bacterium]HPM92814.1 nucleoid-associated protein [Bacteroidales bacterium]
MIEFTNCNIDRISIHGIGNKTNGEDLTISNSIVEIGDIRARELLYKFFLSSFSDPEYYSFTFSNEDFTLNPVYIFSKVIFDNVNLFHDTTKDLAKLLYELSVHPQIKAGDLFVAYFTGISLDNIIVDGIGLFKSENKQSFLKLQSEGYSYSINHDEGINIEKLDKGCLILNTQNDKGYKICLVDKSNKSAETQYWKDDFLKVKPIANEFFQTNQFLSVAKNFVTKQFSKEFEVSRAEQIDLLNKSVEYFKLHETFDKNEFETDVFKNQEVIDSFRNFDSQFRQDNDIELSDQFDISQKAVKKQARIFKSVLKLDKNFHIYIHGDRELIQQGVDPDGRKYYKIYFKEES